MANEVVARHGISISGKTYISTVDLNNSIDSILVLNGSEVQYREISTLPDNSALIYNTPTYPTSIIPTSGSSVSTGNYSTVGGGSGNTSTGNYSTVSGGYNNTASGCTSTIAGGCNNNVSSSGSTIGGGCNNNVSGDDSTIGGGFFNTACGNRSTVGGGRDNTACGNYSTVSGGYSNTASNRYSTVGGGLGNDATGDDSTIAGGFSNDATGCRSTVGGGIYNTASGNCSTIGGGGGNDASGVCSTVGGGRSNAASGNISTVSGGYCNIASGCTSTVGGGCCNTASGNTSTIGGGNGNNAFGNFSTVGGGLSNDSTGDGSTVGGGINNTASGLRSTVGGGYLNTALNCHSTVSGGLSNTASGNDSTIGGGNGNIACGNYSTVSGGLANDASGVFSTVGGGWCNDACGNCSTIGGGINNTASGVRSGILGGTNNLAQCNDSFIIGSNLTATTVCTTFMNNVSVAGGITGNTITAPSSGAITFNGEYSFPTTDGSANTVLTTDGSGNLSFGDIPNTFVTGGTYSDGTATFTNNTGGTFNVSGFFTSADTINIYTTDSTFTSERFANLDGNKLHLTGGTIGVNVLDFVPTDTPPTGNQGQVYFDSADDTLVVYNSIAGTSLQVGQETWYKVKNQSGSNIPDGTLVQASGTDGNSGRITIVSGVTDGTYSPYYIMGLTTHSIDNGEDGWVTSFGEVRGIDTRGQNGETWGDGTILYGDPNRPGGLTSSKPSSPNNTNSIAIVLKASSNGSLFVRPGFSPNLEQMVTGATDGQVITYDSGTGTYQPEDPNNIYNNDGTLDSDRIVDQDTNHLTFSGDSGVSIGTGTTSPVCALLELASTTQGLLIPRMTQAQRLTIPSPQPGLLVYCTDNTASSKEGMYMYKSLGWVNVL